MHTTMALKHASVEMMLGSKSQRQGRRVRKWVVCVALRVGTL